MLKHYLKILALGFIYIFAQLGLIYFFANLYIKDGKDKLQNSIELNFYKLKLEISNLRFLGIENLQFKTSSIQNNKKPKKNIAQVKEQDELNNFSFEEAFIDGFDKNGYNYVSKFMNGDKHIGYGTFYISMDNLKKRLEKLFLDENVNLLLQNEFNKLNCDNVNKQNFICGKSQVFVLDKFKDSKEPIYLLLKTRDEVSGNILIKVIFAVSSFLLFFIFFIYIYRMVEIKKITKYVEEYDALFEFNPEYIFITNGEKFIKGNQAFYKLFGVLNAQDFIERYKTVCELFKVGEGLLYKDTTYKSWLNKLTQSSTEGKFKVAINVNSREHFFLISASKINEYESVIFLRDISYVIQQEAELKKVFDDRLASMHINMKFLDENMMVSSTDKNGIIDYVSKAFLEKTGYKYDELVGRKHSIMKSPNSDPKVYTDMWDNLSRGRDWIGEIQNRDAKGNDFWLSAHIYPKFDSGNRIIGYISVRLDIADKKSLENIRTTDQLTFLKSKNEFVTTFSREVNLAQTEKKTFSLMLIDIDGLKVYNSLYGLKKGDNLIRNISVSVRNTAISHRVDKERLFRTTGGEFAIIYPFENEEQVMKLAEAICKNVYNSNYEHNGNLVNEGRSTVSISIFFSKELNEDSGNQDDIYFATFSKLYQIQKNGGNGFDIIKD